MAALIDSEAQFTQRCKDVKLSANTIRDLNAAGITSLGILAYSHGQPGQALSDAAFDTWIRGAISAGISLADSSGVKRLLFEAHTLVLASLKEQISSPDAHLTRRVPQSERESKMENIKATLVGLNIEGPTEPGHALLDACAQMYHANEVKYLPPERCISRLHEVTHSKQPTKQIELESEKLVVREKQETPHEAAHSALQVKEALERRGIGLVFADISSHTVYTRYLSQLFSHLHRDPPAGYARCTVSQLVQADRLVWGKLLEDGVKPRRDARGDLPVDGALIKCLESYQVSFALLPLPVNVVKKNPKKTDVRTELFDKKKGKGKGKGKSSRGGSHP